MEFVVFLGYSCPDLRLHDPVRHHHHIEHVCSKHSTEIEIRKEEQTKSKVDLPSILESFAVYQYV